jgi:aspartyl aminopeptidase
MSATTTSLGQYLDASPSPFHAAATSAGRLRALGYVELDERDAWGEVERGMVVRGGALIAWQRGSGSFTDGFRIIGAHTDSPGLRIKPQPDSGLLGWRQLGVEVYGGALVNSWLDRDLGVAGRVVTRDGQARLVAVDEAIARVPQLAIHLDREVNDKGLLLDKQQHLTPVWGTGDPAPGAFAEWIAGQAGLAPADVAGWDLQLFDLTPAGLLGVDQTLFASGRLDNQLSCWAATEALAHVSESAGRPSSTAIVALFDHEEVGSESHGGASGPFLAVVIERLALAAGAMGDDLHRALAASSCVSSDNAHAVHPNYPERHEPGHRPMVNRGPAIKVNANQRYATSAVTAAMFRECCEQAGVPWQSFVSRNNMPCGSTIGPLTATRLGIPTVEVGAPQLSMHSARELCGADDPGYLERALNAYLMS